MSGQENYPFTDKDYGELADAAYKIDDGKFSVGTPIPEKDPRFVVVAVADRGNGMQAMAVAPVVEGEPDTSNLIVSYAGTEWNTLQDGKEDLAEVMLGIDVKGGQLDTAKEFFQSVQEQYPEANISTTGHSLGGFLALTVGAENKVPATGFCAPDPSDMMSDEAQEWVKSHRDIYRNYRVKEDAIGGFGKDKLGIEQSFHARTSWAHGMENFEYNDDGSLDMDTERQWDPRLLLQNGARNFSDTVETLNDTARKGADLLTGGKASEVTDFVKDGATEAVDFVEDKWSALTNAVSGISKDVGSKAQELFR